ncbi:MAG: hypothetical protein MZV63_05440 [Marinilabiliales bacterium]|nr:hypothetical protein [Marinilabiliales bacterium]
MLSESNRVQRLTWARSRQLLGSGRKTAALIAPSIASEFDDITDYRKFVGMIRKLGIRLCP